MIQTQLLPLKEPYNVIYCHGQVGIHIATLIVVDEQRGKNGEYLGIETHSHPVVSYAAKKATLCTAEGFVWNRAELKDVAILCADTDKTVGIELITRLRARGVFGQALQLFPLRFISETLTCMGISIDGWPSPEHFFEPYPLIYMEDYVYALRDNIIFYTPYTTVEEMFANLDRQREDYMRSYPESTSLPQKITFTLDESTLPEITLSDKADECYAAAIQDVRDEMTALVAMLNGPVQNIF